LRKLIFPADKLCGVLQGMKFTPRHAFATYQSARLSY
jgi:hypothetical protein